MKAEKNTHGFTLIEMLVVIAIIAILASVLVPVLGKSVERSRKLKAMKEAQDIESAIMLYTNEYNGKFPIRDVEYGNQDNVNNPTDTAYPQQILRVLLAIDAGWNAGHVLNPAQRVFLNTDTALQSGEFLDPWGTQYYIMLDRDFDGKITYPSTAAEAHRKKVVVVSAGPDGDFGDGTNEATEDNIANVELVIP